MTERIVIGVDNGNAYTKTENSTFESGVREMDGAPPLIKNILEFDGKFYGVKRREPYKENKTVDEKTFMLTLMAIGRELELRGLGGDLVEVDLAVGLPIAHYAAQRETFADYFKSYGNEIVFKFSGKPYRINIKSVGVYPQGHSAVVYRNDIQGKKESRSFIVDIGGYTTDVISLRSGMLTVDTLISLSRGIIHLFHDINNRVTSLEGNMPELDESDIEGILMGKDNTITRNHPRIKDIVMSEAHSFTNSLLRELFERGINYKVTPMIFVGGGSLLLSEHINNNDDIVEIEILPDNTANASGYKFLHELSLSRMNKG